MDTINIKTMDAIKIELKKLAILCIEDGHETVEQARDAMYEANPDFRKDELFNQLFPVLFNIALCENKM